MSAIAWSVLSGPAVLLAGANRGLAKLHGAVFTIEGKVSTRHSETIFRSSGEFVPSGDFQMVVNQLEGQRWKRWQELRVAGEHLVHDEDGLWREISSTYGLIEDEAPLPEPSHFIVLLQGAGSVRQLGVEPILKRSCTHLIAEIEPGALGGLRRVAAGPKARVEAMGKLLTEGKAELHIWVDKDDSRLCQQRIEVYLDRGVYYTATLRLQGEVSGRGVRLPSEYELAKADLAGVNALGRPAVLEFYGDGDDSSWERVLAGLRPLRERYRADVSFVPLNASNPKLFELYRRYQVDYTPQVIVIDSGGNQIGRYPGYVDAGTLEQAITEAIKPTSKATS